MKLLVLGGTKFLGRHVVDAGIAQGHDVVLFNRGRTNPELYPQLETVIGDRDGGLSPLEGRRFDGVIDTSGYVPRVVRQSAELLAENCDFYAFISSISVYPDGTPAGFDESAPTQTLGDEASENVEKDYGALKVQCERIVEEAFPARSLHVRAGLIVGPHDPTGRFTYWVHRLSEGGEVLAPAPDGAPVQLIDARDLADWVVRMVAARRPGMFNATGPAARLTLGELLERCATSIGSDARLTWVNPGFLLERDVQPWDGLPLWLPGTDNEGMMQADVGKALSAGLRFRPVRETVRDVHDWIRAMDDPPGKAGLPRREERALLDDWRMAS
jgi:nucleoside-diphosphate-sugar epimerase